MSQRRSAIAVGLMGEAVDVELEECNGSCVLNDRFRENWYRR